MLFWTSIYQNTYKGHFSNGREHCVLKKVEVKWVYWRFFVELGKAPSKWVSVKEAQVVPSFVEKITTETKRSGGIIPVDKLKEERWRKKDKRVGCLWITNDEQALFHSTSKG